jgi:hypothetical protein
MSSDFDQDCFGLFCHQFCYVFRVVLRQCALVYSDFDHFLCFHLFSDFIHQFRGGSTFSDINGWACLSQSSFNGAFSSRGDSAHEVTLLLDRGIRVCFPQFKQVIVMCGSLSCFIRTRLLTPGRMKFLQCLQTWFLYCFGNRIFAAIAIFLALFT